MLLCGGWQAHAQHACSWPPQGAQPTAVYLGSSSGQKLTEPPDPPSGLLRTAPTIIHLGLYPPEVQALQEGLPSVTRTLLSHAVGLQAPPHPAGTTCRGGRFRAGAWSHLLRDAQRLLWLGRRTRDLPGTSGRSEGPRTGGEMAQGDTGRTQEGAGEGSGQGGTGWRGQAGGPTEQWGSTHRSASSSTGQRPCPRSDCKAKKKNSFKKQLKTSCLAYSTSLITWQVSVQCLLPFCSIHSTTTHVLGPEQHSTLTQPLGTLPPGDTTGPSAPPGHREDASS